MTLQSRPATAADLREMNVDMPRTARAWVAEKDGQVIGIAGYILLNAQALVFSNMTDELRKHPRAIVKFGREMMSKVTVPAVCYASRDEKNAGRFLEHLGWQWTASAPEGEVYVWLMP